MSALFEKAIEKIRALPLGMQKDLARVLLQFAGEELPIIDLTPEEEAAVLNSRPSRHAVNSPPTSKYVPSGPSTVCEDQIYPSSGRRS